MKLHPFFIGIFSVVLSIQCNKDRNSDTGQHADSLNIHNIDTNLSVTDTTQTSIDTNHSENPLIFQQYLYVSLNNKKQIAVYKIDSLTGKLALVEKVSVNGSPGSLAYSRNKDYLYAALRSAHEVAAFKIDKYSGKLRFIKSTKVADNPVYIFPDQTNKYLLTAYWSANKVAVYAITGDSIIEVGPIQEFNPGVNPHSIVTSASNKYAYVPVMTSGTVNQYSFNAANGKLTALNPDAVDLGENVGPRHIDFHPNNLWIYILNEINNTLGWYHMDTLTGKLSLKGSVNTLPEEFTEFSKTADVHVSPNGKFVYASNRGHNSIAAFKINQADGSLSLIDQFATETYPREFEIDELGKFLYAGGEQTGKIAAYKMEEDGSLSPFQTYNAGENVAWIMAVKQVTE